MGFGSHEGPEAVASERSEDATKGPDATKGFPHHES